jgi:hypothetical protein
MVRRRPCLICPLSRADDPLVSKQLELRRNPATKWAVAGQAWAGKSLENVDKTLIFLCDPRKLCEEWNL